MVTAPLPSMLGGRDSRRSTWSWCSRSSAASSMVTMRSSCGMNEESTLSVVVLPAPVPPETRMFRRPRTQPSSRSAASRERESKLIRSSIGVGVLGELSDRQLGAVERERRDDGVDTAAVGQAGVHHRAGLVDAAADLADDLVDRAAQVRLVRELGVGLDQLAAALDVDAVEGVDHDFGQVGVAQQRLERAVAEDVVRDLLGDAGPVDRGHRLVGVGQRGLQRDVHLLLELGLRHVGVVELGAQRLDELGVHDLLERRERVAAGLLGRGQRGQRVGRRARSGDGGRLPAGRPGGVGVARRRRPRERRRGGGVGGLLGGSPAAYGTNAGQRQCDR